MREIAKKCIEIGIIKDLYEQGILTEEEMKLAIIEIDKDFERRVAWCLKQKWEFLHKEVLLRKTKDNKSTIIKKTAIHNDIEK